MADEGVLTSWSASCPFCEGTFYDALDPETKKTVGLVHTLPVCSKFDESDPTEFLKSVNDLKDSSAFDRARKGMNDLDKEDGDV
jgi:hypothetical protein